MEDQADGCFGFDQVLVDSLSGFNPDSVDLFNDRIEIAGECSVKDIEFPEAFVEISEPDPLPRTKKRKRQKVRPYIIVTL